MTTIKTQKLARVRDHAVLVCDRKQGVALAEAAAQQYQKAYLVFKDDYNGLLRVGREENLRWGDEVLFEAVPRKPAAKADPRALVARRQDGQHFDQRTMHQSKVRAAEWRRSRV